MGGGAEKSSGNFSETFACIVLVVKSAARCDTQGHILLLLCSVVQPLMRCATKISQSLEWNILTQLHTHNAYREEVSMTCHYYISNFKQRTAPHKHATNLFISAMQDVENLLEATRKARWLPQMRVAVLQACYEGISPHDHVNALAAAAKVPYIYPRNSMLVLSDFCSCSCIL